MNPKWALSTAPKTIRIVEQVGKPLTKEDYIELPLIETEQYQLEALKKVNGKF